MLGVLVAIEPWNSLVLMLSMAAWAQALEDTVCLLLSWALEVAFVGFDFRIALVIGRFVAWEFPDTFVFVAYNQMVVGLVVHSFVAEL